MHIAERTQEEAFKISTLFLCLLLAACEDEVRYTVEPVDGITMSVLVGSSDWRADLNATFVSSQLAVNNETGGNILFNIGEVTAKIGGTESTATHYDSLASAMPRVEELAPGTTTYEIYFVFPRDIEAIPDLDFELTEFGLQESTNR